MFLNISVLFVKNISLHISVGILKGLAKKFKLFIGINEFLLYIKVYFQKEVVLLLTI